MSNSRAFRRRMARGPKVDTRSAFTVAHLGGALNVYYCTTCRGFTVTVDTAPGTTPAMLACRAGDSTCGQMAVSLGYPKVWPVGAPETPGWEWYRPSAEELAQLREEEREAYDHVVRGGLLLRAYGAARGNAPIEAVPDEQDAPVTVVTPEELATPGVDLRSVINHTLERAELAAATL
ncbi:hypothetical protein JNW90_00885 [Micromonospora sp. STR1s_5]|nr:hypothetical protein [Micromonospora sp. STR1s_5]